MPLKFSADVSSIGIDLKIEALKSERLLKKAALILEQTLVDGTPVDTGLLRANWLIGTGSINRSPIKRKIHRPSIPPNPKNNTLVVYNNINYVVYANLRSRHVAPHWIERAITTFSNHLKNLIRRGIFQ